MTGTSRGAAALAAIGACACGASQTGSSASRPVIAITVPAVDGGEINLAKYRGRVVVVHLFTTWSMASQLDLDQLEAAHARAEDVVVVGIGLDIDGQRLIAPWRAETKVRYTVAIATEALRTGHSSLGRIAQVPTTLVLDRRGRLAKRIDGPLQRGQLGKLLAALVKER